MSRADHYSAIEARIFADVEKQEAVVSELWAAVLAAPTTETRAAHERASRTLRELCASGMLACQHVIEEMKRDGTSGVV